MSANSSIEWTDHTFNTHWGCNEISPGCDNCYARTLAARFGTPWGVGAPRREFGDKHWNEPLKWDRKAAAAGVRVRVFSNSMSDLFDKNAPAGVRERWFALTKATPSIDWLALTKRIGNVASMLPEDWGDGYANVLLGATLVNREEMLRDGPKLKATPARRRFWSYEPALGPLGDIPPSLLPDWVICGGESGPGARPFEVSWARSIAQQCRAAGVAFHMKQLGAQPRGWCVARLHADEDASEDHYCDLYEAHECGRPCDRCAFMEDKKGGDMAEWPEEIRVREFPRSAA